MGFCVKNSNTAIESMDKATTTSTRKDEISVPKRKQQKRNALLKKETLISKRNKATPLTTKPIYSYSALIMMALKNGKDKRATLSEIYDFITTKFPFYQKTSSGWQNSIRHNLSLNRCFVKLPRTFENTGKGCYWAINPQNNEVSIVETTGKLQRHRPRFHSYSQQGCTPLPQAASEDVNQFSNLGSFSPLIPHTNLNYYSDSINFLNTLSYWQAYQQTLNYYPHVASQNVNYFESLYPHNL